MPGLFGMNIIATVLIIGGILLVSGVKILKEYERAVIFRLGRMVDPRGPGIIYVIPLIERMLRVDLRTVPMDVPEVASEKNSRTISPSA
ncbi:MAG: SPFH domain-containing protein [Deltaproteobacteria bacterium]|nr:SPFH domain-containing protein [Deltaproteobacteria bacterium]